jgi:hypothetical protein
MKRLGNQSLIVLGLVALYISGCSFADSSYSSSSPSRSSSRSSKGSQEKVQVTHNSYQEEVASLAVVYVGSQEDAASFQRELARISSRHGINDWGGDRETFLAIGRGLKRAKVPKNSIQYLSFLKELKSLPHYGAIHSGYDER